MRTLLESDSSLDVRHTEALLKTGLLQTAIFNSANFSAIATDERGSSRSSMWAPSGCSASSGRGDEQDHARRHVRSRGGDRARQCAQPGAGTTDHARLEALAFKASRGIEDIYELTYVRKDRKPLPAVVSVTALRDAEDVIIGYLLIGTDNTARKQAEEALLKAGALQSAIFNSANFSSIATDAKGVIQIFNVGAERMLGYAAAEVMNKITPADMSDPAGVIARAKRLSLEFATTITPGFEALVFKASRGSRTSTS
jgi:PAS domain-containing protein